VWQDGDQPGCAGSLNTKYIEYNSHIYETTPVFTHEMATLPDGFHRRQDFLSVVSSGEFGQHKGMPKLGRPLVPKSGHTFVRLLTTPPSSIMSRGREI